jgi:hypothetical protein
MLSNLDKRLNRFSKNRADMSIREYYNIPNNKNEKLNINIIKTDDSTLTLNVDFHKFHMYKFNKLPLELNVLISSYCEDIIELKIHIICDKDTYPFTPSIWKLINVRHNIQTLLHMYKYYMSFIDEHNCTNSNNKWSPATCIEKDVLIFISRILKFE